MVFQASWFFEKFRNSTFLQNTSKLKFNELLKDWQSAIKTLSNIQYIAFPRKMFDQSKSLNKIQLHDFSNVRRESYSACIYIRSIEIVVNFDPVK